MWFLSQLIFEGLLQKPPAHQTSDWNTAVTSHAAVNSDARSIQISKYSDTPLSKQLQCNKAKLSEPASVNGLHIHRALGYASQTDAH